MLCPACESEVVPSAAECPACRADLGQWKELDSDAAYFYAQGIGSLRAGDTLGAAMSLTKAVILNPTDGRALKTLGKFLAQQRRYDDAIFYLDRCVKSGGDAQARAALEKARALRAAELAAAAAVTVPAAPAPAAAPTATGGPDAAPTPPATPSSDGAGPPAPPAPGVQS